MTGGSAEILIHGDELVPLAGEDVLAPLSYSVRAGSVTCFVGPDGSGKSRYLRMLAGIDAVSSGQLTLLGRNAYNLDQDEWRQMRARIGFLGSNTPLVSFFSGWQNLMFPPLYHRLADQDKVEARARELVAIFDVDADLEELPAYLSDLNIYKLTIIRALMLAPMVLFLDEPFRRFDTCSIRPLLRILLNMAREKGLAVVIATHDLFMVTKCADQVFFCGGGDIRSFAGGQHFLQSTQDDFKEYISGITGEIVCDEG